MTVAEVARQIVGIALRRFYERNGFLPDGARYVDEGLELAEVRHVR